MWHGWSCNSVEFSQNENIKKLANHMFTKSNIMFERFVKFVENVYPVLKSACLKYDNHVKVNNMVVYKK